MSFTALYESRSHTLKPISIALTLTIMFAGMILGSIMAVVLSWIWILFTAVMLAIHSLRMRLVSFNKHSVPKKPITIDGDFTVINPSAHTPNNRSI